MDIALSFRRCTHYESRQVWALPEGDALVAPTLDDLTVEYPAPDAAVAVFSGEHDRATKDAVRDVLDSLIAGHDLVVADFSRAKFVDAAILGALLDAQERASERGATLRLQVATPTIVRRAFEVSGAFDLIQHFPTREEALAKSGA